MSGIWCAVGKEVLARFEKEKKKKIGSYAALTQCSWTVDGRMGG
jgi:hypothetical protein